MRRSATPWLPGLPTWARPTTWGIRTKVVALALACVAVTGTAMGVVSAWQSGRFADTTEADVATLVDEGISRTASGVSAVVETQGQSTAAKVDDDLAVAQYVMARSGSMSVGAAGPSSVTWRAKNQFSGKETELRLPPASIGERWLGQNADVDRPTIVVDQIKDLVGGTATIFQRTGPAGDMLRVATNVVAASGDRAIGTYIPAVMPDGKPNAVLSAVLEGETYRGNAFVVDTWYVSAYTPISDRARHMIGMLYVGQKQENLPALRESITGTKVGENGYVQVFGGTADRAGTVLIGREGAQEGENLLEAPDAEGTRYVQQIVEAAVGLDADGQATVHFVDPDLGPSTARVTYYQPWDWVIATVARDEIGRG